jgi:phosphoribosylamine--glycine ligase
VGGLRAEGLDFTGFVYLGAVLTARGPVVIEINARFGDSEAEVVLPGVRESFTELCRAVLGEALPERPVDHDGRARCSVALVQGGVADDDGEVVPGWPFGRFLVGQPVSGLDARAEDATLFYANVRRDAGGRPVTSGGRVLHVVGAGADLDEARAAAYRRAEGITFPGVRYRGDIGVVRPAEPVRSGP